MISIYRCAAGDWHPRLTPDAFVHESATANDALIALNARMRQLDWSEEDENGNRIEVEPPQFQAVKLVDRGATAAGYHHGTAWFATA